MTEIESTANKKCKNCGKFFVPDNRVDELYCNSIYENNKTCKEVGPFRTKQKLMQENDDLRIKIAKQANADAQQYSWERALMLFEKYMRG